MRGEEIFGCGYLECLEEKGVCCRTRNHHGFIHFVNKVLQGRGPETPEKHR